MQPVRRYQPDAAILFQDIMTPLPSMGIDIDFKPGPVIARPIRSRADVDGLRLPHPDEIAPAVPAAIRLLRQELAVPLIGFAGTPLTVAAYLIQGGGSKDYATFRSFLRTEPEAAHALLDKLTEQTIAYLRLQTEAGAQAVQLFDSWAGLHNESAFAEFGAPYVRRVLEGVTGVPRIYFANDAQHLYPQAAELPAEVIGVDWRQSLDLVRRHVPGKALQGNLDPAELLAPQERLVDAANRVLRAGRGGAHIFNLGHGIFPTTDPGNVQRLVDTVRAFDRNGAN